MKPLDGRLHFVERNAWFFKNAVSAQRTLFNAGFDLTAIGVHFENDIGIFNTGPSLRERARLAAVKGQFFNVAIGIAYFVTSAFRLVLFGPLKLQGIHRSDDFVFLKNLTRVFWQWQLQRNVSKRKQV